MPLGHLDGQEDKSLAAFHFYTRIKAKTFSLVAGLAYNMNSATVYGSVLHQINLAIKLLNKPKLSTAYCDV